MKRSTLIRAARAVVVAVTLALVVAGCGGSSPSHSSEISKLRKTLNSNPKNFGIPVSLPTGVVSCMTGHAGKLSTYDLTLINGNWKVASQTTHRQLATLLGACLNPATTKRLEQVLAGTSPLPGSAELSSCYRTQLASVSPARFDPFIVATIGGTPAQKAAAETQLAASIGPVCLQQPGVLSEIRQLFASGVKQLAAHTHAPAAYTNCVLHVAANLTAAQAEPLLSPATSATASKALAKPCASLL